MYQHLLFEVKNGIATITLNRPDRFNAFNNEMSYEFIDALKKIRSDNAVRCCVITGSGDKAFSSGQDLKDIQGQNRSLGESVANRYNPIITLISTTEKPFIARVNGVAAGAGAGIALACDVVVAQLAASFVFAFINVGLVPDSGTSYVLPRLVGRRKAFELVTLGEKITAEAALQYGMINRAVPIAELDETVALFANKYAEKPPIALGLTKRMLNRSFQSNLETMLELELFHQEICGRTEDYQEGTLAFVEKRTPNFKGK